MIEMEEIFMEFIVEYEVMFKIKLLKFEEKLK